MSLLIKNANNGLLSMPPNGQPANPTLAATSYIHPFAKNNYHENSPSKLCSIESPLGSAIGHCLLLEENQRLTLMDAGIGWAETLAPDEKLGQELIEITGFKFDEGLTAIKQIEKLGLHPQHSVPEKR